MFDVYIDPLYFYQSITHNVLLFTNVWKWLLHNSETMRNITQSIQALVTSFGIVSAGIWFYTKRQQFPRANLTHKIIHKELAQDTLLIHITVTVENISNVPIEFSYCKMRIQWVSPLDENVEKAIKESQKYGDLEFCILAFLRNNKLFSLSLLWVMILKPTKEKIPFPTIESKEWNFKDSTREDNDRIVEPGEKHNIDCDFIINTEKFSTRVTTLMIYCYIENIKYSNRTLGWHFVDIHNL